MNKAGKLRVPDYLGHILKAIRPDFVMPAKAGIQSIKHLDPRFRGDDGIFSKYPYIFVVKT